MRYEQWLCVIGKEAFELYWRRLIVAISLHLNVWNYSMSEWTKMCIHKEIPKIG